PRIEALDLVVVTVGDVEDAAAPGDAERVLQADRGALAVDVAEVEQSLADESPHPAGRAVRPEQQVDGADAADLAVRQVEDAAVRVEGQPARLSEHRLGQRAVADVLAAAAGPRQRVAATLQ